MLDPVPTFLVRESVNLLLPFLTTLVNTSLIQGRLPASQKHAIVTPHLKKSGLDPTDIANFRPVSNLTFMSKVIERAAASHLNTYLSENGLMPPLALLLASFLHLQVSRTHEFFRLSVICLTLPAAAHLHKTYKSVE